jgi:hypothetical protein
LWNSRFTEIRFNTAMFLTLYLIDMRDYCVVDEKTVPAPVMGNWNLGKNKKILQMYSDISAELKKNPYINQQGVGPVRFAWEIDIP